MTDMMQGRFCHVPADHFISGYGNRLSQEPEPRFILALHGFRYLVFTLFVFIPPWRKAKPRTLQISTFRPEHELLFLNST